MIKICDNPLCADWVKLADPILAGMGIDMSKIPIEISEFGNTYLPNIGCSCVGGNCNIVSRNGVVLPAWKYKSPIFDTVSDIPAEILIRNDLLFGIFIRTYAHKVGHLTQRMGLLGYPHDYLRTTVSEAIALKFQREFLLRFNNEYSNTAGIPPIDDKIVLKSQWTKILPLITKSEYALKV